MFLTEKLDDSITFQETTYHIDMTFDNILSFTEMLEDEELEEYEKIFIGLEMLVIELTKENLEYISLEDQFELLMSILKHKLSFIPEEQESNSEQSENGDNAPKKKEYDFKVDGERIYASFLMDYDIDLLDVQGKLHWKKFLALFGGLSEKTPFMQVVNIRNQEVPKPNKHNAKERKRIQDLKRKYTLEQPDLQSGLDQAASFLRRNAKVGEK